MLYYNIIYDTRNPEVGKYNCFPDGIRSPLTGFGAICEDIKPGPGQDILLLVNGMGGTPLLELYGMYNAASRQCGKQNLTIARSLVGNYCTSLEMAGCSLTLVKLDDEMKAMWDAPVHTAALRRGM